MAIAKQKRAHIWHRDEHDWYVEPPECSLGLLHVEKIVGPVWDPACGIGNIIQAARHCGLEAFGTDIVDRNGECADCIDFLTAHPPRFFKSIVCNPPFSKAEDFVKKAIAIAPDRGIVAMLLPIIWMAGFSAKRHWLPHSPLKTVLPISPRPSMPPGSAIMAGIRPGNGTKDYAWFVWERGYHGAPTIRFLDTRPYRPSRPIRERLRDESEKQWNFAY